MHDGRFLGGGGAARTQGVGEPKIALRVEGLLGFCLCHAMRT